MELVQLLVTGVQHFPNLNIDRIDCRPGKRLNQIGFVWIIAGIIKFIEIDVYNYVRSLNLRKNAVIIIHCNTISHIALRHFACNAFSFCKLP